MQVTHPRAGEAPLPSVATVAGEDYPITDGGVECPDDVARQLADAWARRFGVDPDDILLEDGPPPDDAVTELTYDQLYELAKSRDIDGRSEMSKDDLIAALRED